MWQTLLRAGFARSKSWRVRLKIIGQIATGKPPDCGCLGVVANYAGFLEDARFVLARNAMFLLALLSAGAIHISRRRPDVPNASHTCCTS